MSVELLVHEFVFVWKSTMWLRIIEKRQSLEYDHLVDVEMKLLLHNDV